MQFLVICLAYPEINPIILTIFLPLGEQRTMEKCAEHGARTKPDIKHTFTRLTEQKSFISSSCIIIANIKFTFWQELILKNRFSEKCPFRQTYFLASVNYGK